MRLVSLSEAAQEIEVSPNAARFGIEWISDDVDKTYRIAVSGWIDGFAKTSGMAFSAAESRRKPIADSFMWGESYYTIWKRKGLIVPEALSPQLLSSYEGWNAALITLPTIADAEVAKWLQRSFGMRVLSARRQWGILYPPPVGTDLDGRIRIVGAGSVVVGFSSSDDSDSATLSVRSIPVSRVSGNDVIHVIRDNDEALAPLRLQWGSRALQPIVAAKLEWKPALLPAVQIITRQGELDLETLFHSREARQALDRVREGKAKLVAILLPAFVSGALDVSEDGGPWKKIAELTTMDSSVRDSRPSAIPSLLLQQIAGVLANKQVGVRLSFGVFGQYLSIGQTANAQLPLPSDLKGRLLWYCLAAQDSASPLRVTGRSTDEELVSAFSRIQPPPPLIGHRNLLRKKLGRATGEQVVR